MSCDVCQQQDEDADDDEVDDVAGDNAEDVVGQDTEASREKPRNIPASVAARPDGAGPSTDTAGREETPVVAFGTRKKSAPFLTLSVIYLFIMFQFLSAG